MDASARSFGIVSPAAEGQLAVKVVCVGERAHGGIPISPGNACRRRLRIGQSFTAVDFSLDLASPLCRPLARVGMSKILRFVLPMLELGAQLV
jgi:hypothetical protein